MLLLGGGVFAFLGRRQASHCRWSRISERNPGRSIPHRAKGRHHHPRDEGRHAARSAL